MLCPIPLAAYEFPIVRRDPVPVVPVMDEPQENPAGAATQEGARVVPFDCRKYHAVPFASIAVTPAEDWYGMLPPVHPARLVAVVAVPPQIAT